MQVTCDIMANNGSSQEVSWHEEILFVNIPCDADIVPRGGEHAGKIRVEDFLEIKKTQLKGAKAEAVTDKKKVNANHADGSPFVCSVQGIDKHGDGLRQAISFVSSDALVCDCSISDAAPVCMHAPIADTVC